MNYNENSFEKFKACFVIPCYEQHAIKLEGLIHRILPYQMSIYVIDDGSTKTYADKIQRICHKNGLNLIRKESNEGKGSALKLGFLHAYKDGFTHAIQVDSDEQHDISYLKKLLKISKENPLELISGYPIYDKTVPLTRFMARYLTHVCVWVETLSFNLIDSMCGFRSYPLFTTVKVMEKYSIGNRMDFDTDIMVKLYWEKVKSKFFPVKVTYHENGVSYFRYFKDNVLITKMHTMLILGMLKRFFSILQFNLDQKLWLYKREKGSTYAIKFLLILYDLFGQSLIKFFIPIIVFYYYIFNTQVRSNSNEYISIYKKYCDLKGLSSQKINAFLHLREFAFTLLDKFSVWKKKIKLSDIDQQSIDKIEKITQYKQGAVFISSHYGNVEIARAIGNHLGVKFSALIYTKNSKKLNSIMKDIDPSYKQNVIAVEDFNPAVALNLNTRLMKGEWLFCMGDRITTAKEVKNLNGQLLGADVQLPLGPFLLPYLNDVCAYSFHCYKIKDKYFFDIVELECHIEKNKMNRDRILECYAKQYLSQLETLILKDPLQWFNFYKFWNI